MNEVIIMRGIPGSGKSTWIKKHQAENKFIFSADNFFLDDKREYKYDVSKIGEAHNWCLQNFISFLTLDKVENDHAIYVDNTNICQYEVAPYYRIAESLGFNVKIITLHCPTLVASLRGIHNVPTKIIGKMYRNLMVTKLPPWWKHEIISYYDGVKVQCSLCKTLIGCSLLHCHCQIGNLKETDL